MNTQLFLDSLHFLCSDLEARTLRIITKSCSLSSKMEKISRSLVSFRVGMCQSLKKLIQNQIQSDLAKKLKQQLKESQQKLRKLELHALLQKKIKHMQQDSIMNSMTIQDFNTSFVEDPKISQLKNSVLLIEKDLGIYAEQKEDYDDDVSSVIHRSMASLQATPIANRLNSSSISQTSTYSFHNDHNNIDILGTENQVLNKIEAQKSQQGESEKQIKKMKKPSKKKKTGTSTIYSSKGGMLDNLLEESYQSYIE